MKFKFFIFNFLFFSLLSLNVLGMNNEQASLPSSSTPPNSDSHDKPQLGPPLSMQQQQIQQPHATMPQQGQHNYATLPFYVSQPPQMPQPPLSSSPNHMLATYPSDIQSNQCIAYWGTFKFEGNESEKVIGGLNRLMLEKEHKKIDLAPLLDAFPNNPKIAELIHSQIIQPNDQIEKRLAEKMKDGILAEHGPSYINDQLAQIIADHPKDCKSKYQDAILKENGPKYFQDNVAELMKNSQTYQAWEDECGDKVLKNRGDEYLKANQSFLQKRPKTFMSLSVLFGMGLTSVAFWKAGIINVSDFSWSSIPTAFFGLFKKSAEKTVTS